jgi:hypothetical protein
MMCTRLNEELIHDIHHVAMVTIVLLLTVRTDIRHSGMRVRRVHSATILLVQLIIHEIVRTNVSTAVHVEKLIVPICIRTRKKPSVRTTMMAETIVIMLIIYLINQRYTKTRNQIIIDPI